MELIIANTGIRQDAEGRFSFNDLHKAAVSAGHDYKTCQVEHFTRNEKTQELICELLKNGELEIEPLVSTAGRYGGTWGCKELVYAYAMWISPKFHLEVIRAYDTLMTKGMVLRHDVAQQAVENPADFLARAVLVANDQLAIASKKIEQLEEVNAELAPKAAAHELLAISDGDLCLRDAAKAVQVQERKFNRFLIQIGWVHRRQSNGRLVGNAHIERRGLITHRPVPIHHTSGDVETVLQPLITPKGIAKLAELIASGVSA